MTIDQALGEAGNRVYINSETNANAQDFMTEVRLLKQASESMSKLLGSEVADQLTDYVKGINEWIDKHGTEIANAIKTVSENVGKLAGHFVDFITDEDVQETVEKVVDVATESIAETFEGTKKIVHGVATGNGGELLEGGKQALNGAIVKPAQAITEGIQSSEWATGQRSKNEAEAEIRAYKKKMGYDILSIPYDKLTPELQLMFDEYAEKSLGKYRFAGAVKDGIMRPDGTVTQVASDDWVFAARNLGDLARAFVPQNHTAVSAGEYTINQTFNISGGNDMPQVLRQQAYRGTQEGLLELMNESSRRMQLMSGVR
jgi:hypothetical protein